MSRNVQKSHLSLMKLIEQDGNDFCADCGSQGTRWASWNLGIFLCIRCAGIHRNLGVHISKVKSVDLDSWTKEQITSIELMGNGKSQKIYEEALPEYFMRPQTNYAVEEFIRAKYQHKRYCIPKETPVVLDNVITSFESKEGTQKNAAVIEVREKNQSLEESDDSLSDPEYIVQQKQPPKSYRKSLSENNPISLNCTSNPAANQDCGVTSGDKNIAISRYNQSKFDQSFQSSGQDFGSCQHRSYGSSTEQSSHATVNIPMYCQPNYIRQIQDKLTSLKTNLTSKIWQYEEPGSGSSYQPALVENSAPLRRGKVSRDVGQTLSPDLWR